MAGLHNDFGSLHTHADHTILRNDQIYRHHVLRINYTTYDVHCTDDIFNLNTKHRDIMMLHRPESEHDHRQFCYASIIGIYHANVQYIGPGMKDYLLRWMDFLHVWWFEWVPQQELYGLDALRFVQMNDPMTFDFVDPTEVLRGCHLLSAFRHGKLHREQIVTSPIAWDSENWKYYYVNRYGRPAGLCPLTYTRVKIHGS
jgi:hypothetical protein